MHILVTGAAGFIGSHLCQTLLARGDQVVGVDNFDPYYDKAVKQANLANFSDEPNFTFFDVDLRDNAALDSFWDSCSPFDVVVHLAAKAGVRPSIADPVGYQVANILATNYLLEAMIRQNPRPKLVFASSSSVYGNCPTVPFSENAPVDLPISPYAQTKKAGELLCHTYHHLHGLDVMALRFFTVFGPRQRPDLAIHKFTASILAGKAIDKYGDGATSRDYTYIDDIITGVIAAMNRCKGYEIVNLGSDTPVTLNEMIETIESACGIPAVINPMPAQPGDVDRTWANVDKAKSLLGYKPTMPFADGVGRFVDWYKETTQHQSDVPSQK
jgi:UDP-glucuronate 4-epimerase